MQAKAKTEIKFVAGFAMSLVALLVLTVFSYQTTKNYIATENWVTHTHEVITGLDSIQTSLLETETAQRGYFLTADTGYLTDQQTAARQLQDNLQRVSALTADNPVQQQALNRLEPLIVRRREQLNQQIASFQASGLKAVEGAYLVQGKVVMDQIQQAIAQMQGTEDTLRDRRQQLSHAAAHRSLFIIAVGALAFCVLGALATVMFWHDFNLRARAEEGLRLSEERARLMIESVKDYALIMLDPNGRVIRWNDGARRIKGYDAGEIIGRHFSRFYPDEVVQAGFPDRELAIARAEGRVENEGWRLRKDGSRFWADVTISAIRNQKNELLGFTKVTRDLTDQQRARQELQDSRAQLQSILDNTPAIVYVKDLDGRYLFVNRQFELVYERSREQVTGKTVFDVSTRDLAQADDEHHRRIVETQAPMEVEETVLHPGGPRSHLTVKFPLRDASGKIYATSGISTDITERKRMEQIQRDRDRFFDLTDDMVSVAGFEGDRTLLRALMRHMPDAIYFKDPASRFLIINEAQANRFQLANPAEAAGKTDHDFFTCTHADQALADEKGILRTGQPRVGIEELETWRDGRETWVSTTKMPLRDADGRIIGTFGISRDITEQKAAQGKIVRLNDELRSHAAQVEAANQELEAFSYSVSHDLRAPVRHIDGFVKLLDKHAAGTLDERGRRYLDIIGDAAHQMGLLIDDLLVFSRMGRADLHPASVALNSLVDEAIAALQMEIEGRNIHWRIASLPQVQADLSMLRQVWINLIANALKYSRPRDPAEIEIGILGSSEGESVFFVRDNGVGFDMKYVDKLFGVFQRLHRSEEFEGTGIGLANVRRIISRHGGRTWAEGMVSEGATFYFSLPNILNLKYNHQ